MRIVRADAFFDLFCLCRLSGCLCLDCCLTRKCHPRNTCRTPLPFVGQSSLRWGGGPVHGGKQLFFNAICAGGDLVVPAGSMWARNPIPRNDVANTGQGYDIVEGCEEMWGNESVAMCSGMGDGSIAVPNLEIVDKVMIPEGTPPGEYVLGWRWDCEGSQHPALLRRFIFPSSCCAMLANATPPSVSSCQFACAWLSQSRTRSGNPAPT